MKGHVFIGWTIEYPGAQNIYIDHVKAELEKRGYQAVIGGNSGGTIQHGVGATVVSQMMSCPSAIMLFTTRRNEVATEDGSQKATYYNLSGNMLYELGYLNGSKNLNRVLAVYFDDAVNYVPSDLRGSWEYSVKSKETVDGVERLKDPAELARDIVEYFVSQQKDSLNQNKMDMVTDIYALRSILSNHITNPVLYETEIATLVVIFSQSAYMLGDLENSEELLRRLRPVIHSTNCLLAIKSAFTYFDACRSIVKTEYDNMILPDADYRRLLHTLKDLIKDGERKIDDSDPFKYLFMMIVYDYLTFINMMHYAHINPEELPERILEYREFCAKETIRYSELCRQSNPYLNTQFCQLNESYTYRNLALFYRSVNRLDDANEYFEKSIDTRRELYTYFRDRDLNKNIFDQINMEYHLALIDNIFDVDEFEREDRCEELEDYIGEISAQSYSREYLTGKIKSVLEKVRNEDF